MLSWALAFFIIAVISATFGFSGILGSTNCGRYAASPPEGWACPDGWSCNPSLPLQAPQGFVCPDGWKCSPEIIVTCGSDAEIAKILFVVFVVLFLVSLVSLVSGLLQRP